MQEVVVVGSCSCNTSTRHEKCERMFGRKKRQSMSSFYVLIISSSFTNVDGVKLKLRKVV